MDSAEHGDGILRPGRGAAAGDARRRVAPDLPPALAALTTTRELDLTDVAAWAAFTHQGR